MAPLCDYDLTGLGQELSLLGHNPIHATGILRRYYATAGGMDFDGMGLSRALHAALRQNATRRSHIITRHSSPDGTLKLLISTEDGNAVEAVLMPAFKADRAAGCVSSQIGCAMGCDFCASTRGGLKRSLEAGEIVEQYLYLCAEAIAQGRRLNTLVFMGMGEPMHNLENVIAAIRRLSEQKTGGIGRRHITVSTVGIVPGIEQLAASGLGVHLAVSLHAPDDPTRSRLVPMNRRFKVADILAAARSYQNTTGRIVTIEYCMLAGINDSDGQAHELARLLDGFRAHVNLIPYNWIGSGISGTVYQRPGQAQMARFLDILRDAGTVAHFRRTRGDDVAAACGQLAGIVDSIPS